MAFVPPTAASGWSASRRAAVGERRPVLRVGWFALQRVRGGGRLGRPAAAPPPRMTAAKQANLAQAEALDVDYLPAQKPTKHGVLGVGGWYPLWVSMWDQRRPLWVLGRPEWSSFFRCWRSRC